LLAAAVSALRCSTVTGAEARWAKAVCENTAIAATTAPRANLVFIDIS
jgi:hypothetical protein